MNISFLGLGLMGRPMAERLIGAGHRLIVYNRTREKAAPLEKLGASVAAAPGEAVEGSPCVIFMVADAPAVGSLLFPPGRPRPNLTGRTVIQMSTISPEESLRLKGEVEAAGGTYIEAPVLGSIPEAEQGRLVVMAGSTPGQFEEWLPLLRSFSPAPIYVGEAGKAAALKLALNHLIAAEAAAFGLSLGVVARNAVDVELFLGILRKSALYAPQFDKKLDRMLRRDFSNPSFPAKHLRKDVRLVIAEARRRGLDTEAAEGIEKIVGKAVDKGWADADYSAIYSVIAPE